MPFPHTRRDRTSGASTLRSRLHRHVAVTTVTSGLLFIGCTSGAEARDAHVDRLRTAAATRPAVSAVTDSLPDITINDNRHAAGHIVRGTLTLHLEARLGIWHPEGRAGIGLTVAAFAEVGKPLQNPGPLIRVPQGTDVAVSMRNTLATPLTIFGLGAERGVAADSVHIAPGATHEFRFHAGAAGTYYYTGVTGRAPVLARGTEDSQLNGAIVVDPPGAPRSPGDRVFIISWWYRTDETSPTGLERATMTINGRSWPHTEQIDAAQGDSLRWRWINLTLLNHPMHLHGFYFQVDGAGDGRRYAAYAPDERRQAVTERLKPGGTMALTWVPNRPGNWIFHCHAATHMSHLVSIGTERGVPAHHPRLSDNGSHDTPAHAMAGLVLGVRVTPRGKAPADPREYRPLRLVVRSHPNTFGDRPGFSYTLDGARGTPDDSAFRMPGPTLVLRQHEPVAVTIVNRSVQPAAVHWHGIELESFPDGVPGWSGTGTRLLPAIAPGESLTVRFTPPRAGTFMYHSHFNEAEQIASGLHGPIVVLPPGAAWHPDTDRIFLFGDNGPTENLIRGPYPAAHLNGAVTPEPLELRAGVTYRLRFINIRTDYLMAVALRDGASPVQWRLLAKDGADLPPAHRVMTPAELTFAPGEIHDVEFTPRAPGELTLQYRTTEPVRPDTPATTVTVRVR